nr:hypothetical protein CFP56_28475 [Quercus suber]
MPCNDTAKDDWKASSGKIDVESSENVSTGRYHLYDDSRGTLEDLSKLSLSHSALVRKVQRYITDGERGIAQLITSCPVDFFSIFSATEFHNLKGSRKHSICSRLVETIPEGAVSTSL